MSTHLQRRAHVHQPSFTLHPRSFRLPVLVVCLLFASLLPAAVTHAGGSIVYVKPGGTGNGSSWATAADLAPALLAATSGTQLWVAQGTYLPTTTQSDQRQATFRLKNGVAIYGGFNGTETQLSQRNAVANPVILSGDIGTPNDRSDNSYHVVVADGVDATAILDGVTITRGYANGNSDDVDSGGGMSSTQGSPTLANITFINNTAQNGGGGMFNNQSSPTLANIIFINNTAATGGGMFNLISNPMLTDVIFTANAARGNGGAGGGGMFNNTSNIQLTNVTFTNNSTDYTGGGMNNSQGNTRLTNVVFSGNTAESEGGAIHATGGASLFPLAVLTLTNVVITGNHAVQGSGGGILMGNEVRGLLTNVLIKDNVAQDGGGISTLSTLTLINVILTGNRARGLGGGLEALARTQQLINVVITGNAAGRWGGGVLINSYDARFTNVTIANNTAPQGSGIYADTYYHPIRLSNSIVWNDFYDTTPFASDVQYSDVQGGYPGTGNLDVDPRFVAPGSDYHLRATSPVIDQGNNSFVPAGITKDLDGNPRIVNGAVDMGAYEYQGATIGASK